MPYTMEHNKIVGAILTAMIAASASGNLARILYPEEKMEEPLIRVEAAAAEETAVAGEEAAAPRSLPERLAAADPELGRKVAKKCAGCHGFEKGGPDKVGPNLWGVVGRPVAAAEGFAYSEALRALGGTWTFERLDAFLADPKGFAPGTKMAFAGLRKPEDRANLLAWMAQQADAPVPLPAAATETEAAGDAGMETGAAEGAAEAATADTAAAATPAEEGPAAEEAAGAGHPVLALLAGADSGRGEKVARTCKACHTLEKGGPNKVGPNLWGIVGRPVAGVEGFRYSPALREFGGAWSWDRLARFLEDPRGTVPGTRMSFAGIRRPGDLADLLAYLRTLADEPAPLP